MFKLIIPVLLFATAVFGQAVFIGLPTFNQTLTPGDDFIVQIQRPDSLTGSEEVAVVIGVQSCPDRPCSPPSGDMGTILYNGPYDPEFHEVGPPPYQNFTVQLPNGFTAGTASIGVVHLSLVGAGLYPLFETLNQTVTIA